MHTISVRSMALLAAVEVGPLFAQSTVPTFDQYRVTEPKFSGKIMLPGGPELEARYITEALRVAPGTVG